jgi:branched-chain amino acid transport system substrate-binding protein
MMQTHFKKSMSFLGLLTVLTVAFSSAFAAKPTLKLGAVFSMSGATASFGQESMDGVRLAIEEINKKGDVKIDLVLADDKSESVDAANAIRKLINVDRVNVVVGSVPSSITMAMAPIAQAAKVPLLSPSSTNVKVTDAGDYISRICFIDDFQGSGMAKFATEVLKAKTAAIVTDSRQDYSKGLGQSFKDSFEKMGGKINVEVSYQSKDQDFSSQLTKIRTRKPDVIFVPGYYGEVANMIRQATQMGIKTKFIGGDGWSAPELFTLAGPAIAGNYFADHFSPDDTDPQVKGFVTKYQGKYKRVPSAMAALGYDSVYVVAEAFKKASGKTDGESLKNAINSTQNYVGVTGSITLDAKRNAHKPLVVLETTPTTGIFKTRIQP